MKTLNFLLAAAASVLLLTMCAPATEKSDDMNQQQQQTVEADSAQVLVLLAHPDMEKSLMNKSLSEAAAAVDGVKVVNVYDYPVTPEAYRDAFKQAKAVVFQFPFYWMSAPHLLKQWTDEVFTLFASEGLTEGKQFMVVTTTGSEEAAYQHDGRNLYTLAEYLRPYEGMANHSKMVWNEPLVVYGNPADAALAEQQLKEGVEQYVERLNSLLAK